MAKVKTFINYVWEDVQTKINDSITRNIYC